MMCGGYQRLHAFTGKLGLDLRWTHECLETPSPSLAGVQSLRGTLTASRGMGVLSTEMVKQRLITGTVIVPLTVMGVTHAAR
jgi:hypothetical protein